MTPSSDMPEKVSDLVERLLEAATNPIWSHTRQERLIEAASALTEARALIDTLQRERDEARDNYQRARQRAADAVRDGIALEAEVTRLREALEPFAEHDTGAVEAVGIFSIPDEHPLLGTGLGNDWRPSITVGDFRRARSALSKDTP